MKLKYLFVLILTLCIWSESINWTTVIPQHNFDTLCFIEYEDTIPLFLQSTTEDSVIELTWNEYTDSTGEFNFLLDVLTELEKEEHTTYTLWKTKDERSTDTTSNLHLFIYDRDALMLMMKYNNGRKPKRAAKRILKSVELAIKKHQAE